MSDNTNNSPPPSGRRHSVVGQTLAELFGNGRPRASIDNSNITQTTPTNPGSVSSAAAQAQKRHMSVSGQAPAFLGKRSDSIASSNSSYADESAIEDGEAATQGNATSPFARRMSFGARALRDVRTGSSPTDTGYNWADSFRNRAERRASIASSSPPAFSHMKAKSIASSQPAPVKEVARHNVPDHFQERILKGDFYMD